MFKLVDHPFLNLLLIIGLRYFLIAAIGYFICYKWLYKKIAYKKIQQKLPLQKDYIREIVYSSITIIIFSAIAYTLLAEPMVHYTTYYKNISEKGMLWFWLAFPIMLVMHDAYFYITHRLMHHKKLFNLFHLLHHKSTNPSPWAAFAFHPLEAVVEAGIIIVFLFTIPVHLFHLFFFFLFMMVYNVYGHLGWELYPKGFSKSVVGKWINTSVNHNQHHQYFKGNYGLYFLWWDRLFNTIRTDYDAAFEKATHTKTKGHQHIVNSL
jgi:Delta7-sterol 5-desaturase